MFSKVRGLLGSGSGGGANYPYVTARVRALKTHLLPEEEFPKLIARDVHEIARSLAEARYKTEVDELASEYAGATLIERATRLNLGREFQRILSWCRGEPRALVGHYMERYTVYNMKTLMRGAQAGATREETEAALIPAGVVPMSAWNAALGAESLTECLEMLPATDYTALVREMEDQPIPRIENALDIAYYEHLVGGVDPSDRPKKAFLSFLRREVDVVNLKLVLRTKHADVTDVELVPGGRQITDELARRIHSAGWDEVAALLDETELGDAMKPALEDYRGTRELNRLVGRLDTLHLEEADEFGHLYPLSILPIIDYVLRKELEVDRIRMIAFGKQAGLTRDEIEELVTV